MSAADLGEHGLLVQAYVVSTGQAAVAVLLAHLQLPLLLLEPGLQLLVLALQLLQLLLAGGQLDLQAGRLCALLLRLLPGGLEALDLLEHRVAVQARLLLAALGQRLQSAQGQAM